ncbi:PREDICTED: FK506-binding protein 3-like [Habropoda laboriosa]|uniref:FK506-binding protein 3-like n=1 Tax=Habropoda laboriosa TaxID=597456 RepID=UPI00083CB1AC|nr:PREDICTED: FK506-binding protein 3-like [Habropoda laboriosa]
MRLSAVVELLLILLLVAFAAYGRVIEHDESVEERSIRDLSGTKQANFGISTLSLKQAADNVNRYCTCNENICNCCRDFHIPLVQLQGPGCASLQYLQGDNLAVQLSFGDNILTSTIVNGKSPKPVCVPLPGGFTKFCGRIYSIKRDAKNHFKACLGLELQSDTELEASLRVSCFRFGPDGLKLRPAEPLPVIEAEVPDEDDDDDFFGLGSDDDDEEDDDSDEDTPEANSVQNSSTEEDEDEDEDEDVLGFGALLDIITGEDEPTTKKPKVTTAAPLLQFTIPLLTKPTSSPLVPIAVGSVSSNDPVEETQDGEESLTAEEENITEDEEESPTTDVISNEAEELVTVASNKIASYSKPDKTPTKKFTASEASKKKPTITSTSINAIENEANKKKKPLRKPVKGDEDDDDDLLGGDLDDDEDDDEEDEEILDDDDEEEKDSEEEEDEDEKIDESGQGNHEDEDKSEVEDLDDDDDDEEDALISALAYDEKEDGKKKGKLKKHQLSEADDDDSDYGLGLTGLLARSRHSRNSRQSEETRI